MAHSISRRVRRRGELATALLQQLSCMRIDFGGLQWRLEFHEPARTWSVVHGSWQDAVVVPLDLLLSYRRTSSSHCSSPAARSCSLHRSGTKISRRKAPHFPPLRGSNDGPNDSTPPDLVVLLEERYRSFHFLSRPEVHHGLLHSLPEHHQLVLHPADRTVDLVLRSWPCLSRSSTHSTTGRKLGESRRFSLERWRFPKTFDSRLRRWLDRGFALEIAVWTACPTAAAVSASPGEPPCLNCWFWDVNFEISWFKACCCPCNVFTCASSSSVATSFSTYGHVNCNCFDSFHFEGSREHNEWCVSTLSSPRTNLSPDSQNRTEQYRTLPEQVFDTRLPAKFHQSTLVYETKKLRYNDGVLWHMNSILSQTSRSCFTCHCATQLTLEKCGI